MMVVNNVQFNCALSPLRENLIIGIIGIENGILIRISFCRGFLTFNFAVQLLTPYINAHIFQRLKIQHKSVTVTRFTYYRLFWLRYYALTAAAFFCLNYNHADPSGIGKNHFIWQTADGASSRTQYRT